MIAVLFAREDSVYKGFPGCDVYDARRDARTYDGPWPVIAHPPCRAWGRLAHPAKPESHEKALALHAVDVVRQCGGVLEHPSGSRLWDAAGLPMPSRAIAPVRDVWGGWTLAISQRWFDHEAEKRSWLYVVGVEPSDLPEWPISMHAARSRVQSMGRKARMATPEPLARWLVDLASRVCWP